MLRFMGENVLAFLKMLRGKAQFRWSDTFMVMQECGPQALGIVALINFLIGLILAFVGATELANFGASIYTADLVAIATVREMGCIMTGIILCGRTGAAFAAQLGTMKVNQEIEAFQTFGISPIEFLVLPRMLALILMMPLLCVFADLIAIARRLPGLDADAGRHAGCFTCTAPSTPSISLRSCWASSRALISAWWSR